MAKKLSVIGVIGQKGGGGKTTIAINIAVAAARHKLAPVIIDLDQQTNSAKWRDRRKPDNVAVVATPAGRIKATIEMAASHEADFIVIDAPGHNDSAAIETLRAAHLVILPVEAQMFHFDTLPAMRDIIRLGGDTPTWIVVNKLHPAVSVMAKKLKQIIFDTYKIPVCPVHMCRYDIYATSADDGLTPEEKKPTHKAALEIRELYRFINQQLNNARSPHVRQDEKSAAGA
jgi:chromosome partitioning protein